MYMNLFSKIEKTLEEEVRQLDLALLLEGQSVRLDSFVTITAQRLYCIDPEQKFYNLYLSYFNNKNYLVSEQLSENSFLLSDYSIKSSIISLILKIITHSN